MEHAEERGRGVVMEAEMATADDVHDAEGLFAAAVERGAALPYPASSREFQALVEVARSRQRATLRLLVDASGLGVTELSRRVVAAAPSLSSPLRLGNLLSGNTMANAERAEALSSFFGRSMLAIAPHLVVMPWFSHPRWSRWIRSYAGMSWDEVVRRRRIDRDVLRMVQDGSSFVEVAGGRPPIPSSTMVSVSMLGEAARFFFRGHLVPARADALRAHLEECTSDASDVVETESTSDGRVAFVCDVLMPPSKAARTLGLVGGPLPAGRRLRR